VTPFLGLLLLATPAPAAGAALSAEASVVVQFPSSLTLQTPRGATRLAVTNNPRTGPAVPALALVKALGGTIHAADPWLELVLARQSFRFLLHAPVLMFNDRLLTLAGSAALARDTLFIPLQFVTSILPSVLAERYDWDAAGQRLVETAPPAGRIRPAQEPVRLPNGLRPGHVVTVDAGHGGIDPGNPGAYFPRGVHEKDITLQISRLLRDELTSRGVRVVMTRTTDTLINRVDRAAFCTNECDLFVSLHVDALAARRGYREVRGFHTIIVGEENSEDADRIARMENDAVRYEDDKPTGEGDQLDFILRNLQRNEYLRESARAAELVQENIDRVHTGDNRGVKQSNILAVLNTARRPAILVEMGYSTNPLDARLLTVRKSQQALATAIADAIVAYLLEYERKLGTTSAGSGR
jgi:N-acetylmuramoyl-L-alanine amidase